jgi:glutamyl-tRNA synthetase
MAGFFFQEEIELAPDRIITAKLSPDQAAKAAEKILEIFQALPEITQDNAETPLRNLAADLDLKAGQIFGLLREALTGQKVSPPIFDIIPIIGRDVVLSRLEHARNILKG